MDSIPDSIIKKHGSFVKKNEEVRLRLSQCFEFLIAADYLLLSPDPNKTVLEKMGSMMRYARFGEDEGHVMCDTDNPIKHEMIAKIFKLPSAHPARKSVGDFCAVSSIVQLPVNN